MSRFFVSDKPVVGTEYRLTGEDVPHIQKALRIRVGEHLTLCDGRGTDYDCSLSACEKDAVLLEVHSSKASYSEPDVFVTLFQGIAKADKMDWIIQKAVELGVGRIVPVETSRAVVRLDEKDRRHKQQRWQKIAVEAAKQSGRGRIPEVILPMSFPQALVYNESSISYIPWEAERGVSIRTSLKRLENTPDSVGYFIGPEGGLDEKEVSAAQAHGIVPVTLGPRILRTETAALATLSVLMYELGAME